MTPALWFSCSGPLRFEFSPVEGRWQNTRNGSDLIDMLRKEMSEVIEVDIPWADEL